MPSLKLHILESVVGPRAVEEIEQKIRSRFKLLDSETKREAVLSILVCEGECGADARPYWMEVRCSKETALEKVVKIVNHFSPYADVEAFHPQTGAFTFVPKGGYISEL